MPIGIRTGEGERALAAIGFDGERLLRLANRVANDVIAGRVSGIAPIPHLGDRRDDLVSAMVERGLKAALRYDQGRTNGGNHLQSYIAKYMEHAARDHFRKKSEGFGDRRYGNDNRVVLSPMEDDVDPDDFERVFDELITGQRLTAWGEAALIVDLPFAEWVVVTLDRASKQVLRTAAA